MATSSFSNPDLQLQLTRDILPAALPTRRWFTSKGKRIAGVTVTGTFPIAEDFCIYLIGVDFRDGSREQYQLPVALVGENHELAGLDSKAVLGPAVLREGAGVLVDAVHLPAFRQQLYDLVRGSATTEEGLRCEAGRVLVESGGDGQSIVPDIDTSNTAIVYDGEFFFKLFRKLDAGVNPDLELVRYLSEKTTFTNSPAYGGSLGVGPMSDPGYLNLGMMSRKIDNRGDAWAYFQGLAQEAFTGSGAPTPETLDRAALLGTRTAGMHNALSALDPEPMTADYRREITAAARRLLDRQFTELAASLDRVPPAVRPDAERLLSQRDLLDQRLQSLADRELNVDLIRIHGDYHLGQVLTTNDDFYLIDFEGEPLLSIPERRRKRPALKDVGGMLRSFHYAGQGQLLLNPDRYGPRPSTDLRATAETWTKAVQDAYLDAYYSGATGQPYLPDNQTDRNALIELFVLEKAIYEVAYELNSRPSWLGIPINGVLGLL